MISGALQDALCKALQALRRAGVPHAVMGGVAMNVWGRIRATKDIDLLVAIAPGQVRALQEALRTAGFSHQDKVNHTRLADAVLYRFWFPVGDARFSLKLDVVEGRLAFHQDVLARRQEVRAFGSDIPVASREDVILLKLLAGRPIDRVDAVELYRTHRGQLDVSYIESTAGKLGLLDAWSELKAAAESPPNPY